MVQSPYIYVGQLEHTVYDPAGLAKFDEMVQRGELEVVYELERQPLESLTALNSAEVTESDAPLSVFSALSGISGSTPPAGPSSSRCGKRGMTEINITTQRPESH